MNTHRVPWHTGTMIAVDTETTAADPHLDRVVTATMVTINARTGFTRTNTWLLNPGIPISDGAAAIHGISNARAQAEGQDPGEGLAELADLLRHEINAGHPLVLFNAAFDLTLLDREFTRHHLTCPLDQAFVVDGFVLDKRVDPYRRGKRKLTNVCDHYRVRLDGAHDATEDALAAARVAYAIATRFPDLQVPLPVLHDLQREWRAAQCVSLQEYLRRKDPGVVVAPEWPIVPAPAGWDPTDIPNPGPGKETA